MGPTDANIGGNVHGGTIMWMCDEVAGIAAIRHSGCRVVTAGMDRMTFQHPVYVGNLVTVHACVNAVWRISKEVGGLVEYEDEPTLAAPVRQEVRRRVVADRHCTPPPHT